MPITVTIEANDAAHLKQLLAGFSEYNQQFNGPSIDLQAPKASAPIVKAAATPTPKSKPSAASAPETQPTPKAAPAKEAIAADGATGAPNYDNVSDLVLKVVAAKGRQAALDVLAAHGVAKAPELQVDQYPGVIADLNAALIAE